MNEKAASRQLAVIGAGSWGTALAIALSGRFDSIQLWTRDQERAAEMSKVRENRRYLAGFPIPDHVRISHEIAATLDGSHMIVTAVPSAHLHEVLDCVRPHITADARIISATKGIEEGTLRRMSQVLSDSLAGHSQIAVLSGPTFAREIAAGEPAAVVVASRDLTLAEEIQSALATPSLRFYASTDVAGVEIGAALKNVIAIGAGICKGLGLGSNSIAALLTRGLAEITRLAVRMGGEPRTLSGLAGLGDLVLTATGDLSRNRHVGIELGRGRRLDEILDEMIMIAEGVATCSAAHQLGREQQVNLPIVNQMFQVLYESKEPRQAIRELMERPLTSE